jgi:phosphate transport system protein
MRSEFRADLARVNTVLVDMVDEVRAAMRRATRSLLEADAVMAEGVITGDAAVNEFHRELEERIFGLLAQQAPVASDLRQLMSALHVASDFERMGDLAKHVAKVGLRRQPAVAVPDDLVPIVRDMADVADRIAGKISQVVDNPDAATAAELDADDDAMDHLRRTLFAVVLDPAWSHGVESAVDGALLSRFYERFADHAVNAGRRMYFQVTGEQLEF